MERWGLESDSRTHGSMPMTQNVSSNRVVRSLGGGCWLPKPCHFDRRKRPPVSHSNVVVETAMTREAMTRERAPNA